MNTRQTVCFAVALLLLFTAVPHALGQCLIPCPGDINGDCKVNLLDFAIFAQNWLADCTPPTELPVLVVTDAGVSEQQAQSFAELLGIDPRQLVMGKGLPLLFVDPENHLALPTLPVEDQELIQMLLRDNQADDEDAIVFEAIDEAALLKIEPVPPQIALSQVFDALNKSEISLGSGQPETSHTTFELVDLNGELLLPAVQTDTRVHFHSLFNGIPVMGPGAKMNVSFDPRGNVTELQLARRGVESRRESIPLIGPQQALQRAIGTAAASRFVPEHEAQLVYYAPPMSELGVKTLIPHYDIGGIIFTPEGGQFHKLRQLVPAIDDEQYVPFVGMETWVEDGYQVNAHAFARGGQPPYRYLWFSSSVDLSDIPDDQSKVEYWAMPRMEVGPETVTVKVIDDNGIIVMASETVIIGSGQMQALESPVTPQAGGVRDFGISRAVSDLGAVNQSGFRSRFLSDGVTQRFNWTGQSAWEKDFKQPPAGLDTWYVDNTDITFYIGHGYGGGFTFESNQDDGTLTYTDAAGAWGNHDLEWLALLSCQVLKANYGGLSWAQRWGPTFDGLHLLLGFQTNAYDWPQFGRRFADYTLGRQFGFVTLPPLPIRVAWFKAKAEEQPNSVEAVVMGPVGPGGVLGGFNDYFWGKGSVSVDLRGSNIRGFWRQVYK